MALESGTEVPVVLSMITPVLDEARFLNGLRKSINISTLGTKGRVGILTPEILAEKWGLGLDTAKCTLKATTQQAIRTAVAPLSRRYRTK